MDRPSPLELENEDLEEVEEFTFLGSVMSKSIGMVMDITNRLKKAKSSFVQLRCGGHLTSVKNTD